MLMKDRGLSKRKAEKVVNTVFDSMRRALCRGETVELPIGEMKAVRSSPKQRKQRQQRFENIATKKEQYKLVRYPKRIIRFWPKKELIIKGSAATARPASPETLAKAEDVDHLYRVLTGRDQEISFEEFSSLLAAADDNLDRLLARLRQLVKDEYHFSDFFKLCDTVRQRYWI